MNLKTEFEINRQTRKNILYYLKGLSEDQINIIPDGFSNNIAWNFGHILVTQQLLTYGLSGIEIKVPKEWIAKYRKGSKPEERISMKELEEIKAVFVDTIDWAEADYNADKFSNFSAYTTSYGFPLTQIEDVIRFVYAHDALHWGIIMAMLKLV